LAAALLIRGTYVASRQQSTTRALRRQEGRSSSVAAKPDGDYKRTDAAFLEGTHAPGAAGPTSVLMDGIKEELFRLEVERKQDQISQSEYEKAKAGLDHTLDRALKREAQKA
jgi:hypothetical protein